MQTQAKAVVEAAKRSEGVDAPAKVQNRESLAIGVEALKKHQQAVKKLQQAEEDLVELHRKDPSNEVMAEIARSR